MDGDRRVKPEGEGALLKLRKRGVKVPVGTEHGSIRLCFECDTNYTDAPEFTRCIMCDGLIETHEF